MPPVGRFVKVLPWLRRVEGCAFSAALDPAPPKALPLLPPICMRAWACLHAHVSSGITRKTKNGKKKK